MSTLNIGNAAKLEKIFYPRDIHKTNSNETLK
jgi:hypothetical protein